jgi:ArsR family transcriptional regulator
MPGYDFFMKPKSTNINVAVEQVHNTLYSLLLIDHGCEVSGLSPKILEICSSLSDEMKKRNRLVMNGLYYSVIPSKSIEDFDTYLAEMKDIEAEELKSRILSVYLNIYEKKNNKTADLDSVLTSEESYLHFLIEAFGSEKIDIPVEKEAYRYISEPEKMKDLLVTHLSYMWDTYLRDEWETNKVLLHESVKAYREIGVENMKKTDAAKLLGCQSMDCDWDTFVHKINNSRKLYLVPSAHLGPYKGKIYHLDSDEMWLFYGSLMPEGGGTDIPELSKADLLIHFNALTDSIRLEILKLCSKGDEYSSTELMNRLDISQSAVSRHLKQLSATGFLHERRENSSKYYRINKEKIKNTINSLDGYLELSSD